SVRVSPHATGHRHGFSCHAVMAAQDSLAVISCMDFMVFCFLLFAVVAGDGVLDVLVDEGGGLLDPGPDTTSGGVGQVDLGERIDQRDRGGHQNGPPITSSMRSRTSRSWARRARCAVSAAIWASSSAMRSTPPTITVPLPTSVAVYPAARSALMTSVVSLPERVTSTPAGVVVEDQIPRPRVWMIEWTVSALSMGFSVRSQVGWVVRG